MPLQYTYNKDKDIQTLIRYSFAPIAVQDLFQGVVKHDIPRPESYLCCLYYAIFYYIWALLIGGCAKLHESPYLQLPISQYLHSLLPFYPPNSCIASIYLPNIKIALY